MRLTIFALLISVVISPAFAEIASKIDFTGFWKSDCGDPFGIQIKPYKNGLYSTAFCGPGGGCNDPVEPASLTPIEGDPKYEVISPTEIHVKEGNVVYDILYKCTSETNPTLEYSKSDIAERNRGFVLAILVHIGYLAICILAYRYLTRHLPQKASLQGLIYRSALLALFFSPSVIWYFPFAAPTFSLLALLVQVFGAFTGNTLFIWQQLGISASSILTAWFFIVMVWLSVRKWRAHRNA